MKRIDRFILTSFLGPFFAILFIVMFVLMMQFLWVYIDELVGKGLGLAVILEFMMWGGCTIIPLALPLSTLLSSMMVMGIMADHNELIALKAAGVSVTRVMTPIIYASAVITVGAFFANNDLVPYAYNKIYTLRDDILKTKEEIKIPAGTFYDGIEGYILRADKTDDKTGIMEGVMVYDHTRGRGNTNMMMADSARMKMSEGKEFITFTLYNGINYQENNTMRYRDTALELQKINFERQTLIISLSNYAFEKSDSSRYGDQIKSMNVRQLTHEKDSLRNKGRITHESQYARLMESYTLSKSRAQLDTAFYHRVQSNYSHPGFMRWDKLADEVEAYRQAVECSNSMVSTVSAYNRDAQEYLYYLRRADLEYLKKFAGALACFIMFFIGAPIGALVRKGGLGVPAIISVLFFVLYYIIDITGDKLAKDGAVDASVGAFSPFLVLIPIGILLTHRAINDASFSTNDTLKSQWRRIKRAIANFFRKPRIVYMGTPEFAVAPLQRLLDEGFKVVGVVTVADKPSGRGLSVNESAVKKFAVSRGIPVLQPDKLKDPAFLEQLRAFKADLFVVVAFRMLPEAVWSMPRLGTFNLHAALLPQYRGAAPINWAVINGESMTGVTTFMIDKNIDTGGIILREDYRIKPGETAGEVHDALMEIGSELVVQTTRGIIEGNVETRVQQSFIQGSEVLKSAPKLTRELCHIDWEDTTTDIYNLVRGLSPYPTAFTELVRDGSPATSLKIFSASPMAYEGPEAPGSVLSDGKSWLAVRTLDGALRLDDVQLAGKKRMEARAFLAGFRDPCAWSCTKGTSLSELERVRNKDKAS